MARSPDPQPPINQDRRPHRTMAAAHLVELLGQLDGAGIEAWLDGGWGIDALLGEERREHDDVDLIVTVADAPRLIDLLATRDYGLVKGEPGSNFVLHDPIGHQVDVHPVRFDLDGNGVYRMENGLDWIYPADGFTGRGSVLGRPVRCLTAEVQVLCHADYELDAEDYADLRALRDRFGVAVPESGG